MQTPTTISTMQKKNEFRKLAIIRYVMSTEQVIMYDPILDKTIEITSTTFTYLKLERTVS